MTTIDRINTLVRESTETAFETAAFVQRQNAQLFQTWLNNVETSQSTMRDLTLRAIGQVQEAQRLWFEVAQENIRTGVENARDLTETQLKEASEQFDKASRQTKANGNRIVTPAAQ